MRNAESGRRKEDERNLTLRAPIRLIPSSLLSVPDSFRGVRNASMIQEETEQLHFGDSLPHFRFPPFSTFLFPLLQNTDSTSFPIFPCSYQSETITTISIVISTPTKAGGEILSALEKTGFLP